MVLMRLAFLTRIVLLGITFLGHAARAQTGFSGGGANSDSAAGVLLGAAMLIAFSGLIIWGFFSGLDALLPPPSLAPQRRLALRWIGVNRMEPSVTSLLFVIVFVMMQSRNEISNTRFLWLVLPALTFFIALLPPIWFRSTRDAVIHDTWRGLRWIAVARVAPYLLLGFSLLLNQGWLAIAALLIGLGSLFWSLQMLARLAAQLGMRQPLLQPDTSSHRMETDAE